MMFSADHLLRPFESPRRSRFLASPPARPPRFWGFGRKGRDLPQLSPPGVGLGALGMLGEPPCKEAIWMGIGVESSAPSEPQQARRPSECIGICPQGQSMVDPTFLFEPAIQCCSNSLLEASGCLQRIGPKLGQRIQGRSHVPPLCGCRLQPLNSLCAVGDRARKLIAQACVRKLLLGYRDRVSLVTDQLTSSQ